MRAGPGEILKNYWCKAKARGLCEVAPPNMYPYGLLGMLSISMERDLMTNQMPREYS